MTAQIDLAQVRKAATGQTIRRNWTGRDGRDFYVRAGALVHLTAGRPASRTGHNLVALCGVGVRPEEFDELGNVRTCVECRDRLARLEAEARAELEAPASPAYELEKWLRDVYGSAGDGDRGDWARRAAAAFAAGRPFDEPMPRDRYNAGPERLAGIRRAVARLS